MAQYQVTIDGEILQQLFVRDDGLARLVEQVVNQILEAQVAEQLKAERYERTEERQGYRNGHRRLPGDSGTHDWGQRIGEQLERVLQPP